MNKKIYADESRLNYSSENITNDSLKVGCLQRIADATEIMSRNYDNLIHDIKFYKDRLEQAQAENSKLRRSVAAYRGKLGKKSKST